MLQTVFDHSANYIINHWLESHFKVSIFQALLLPNSVSGSCPLRELSQLPKEDLGIFRKAGGKQIMANYSKRRNRASLDDTAAT